MAAEVPTTLKVLTYNLGLYENDYSPNDQARQNIRVKQFLEEVVELSPDVLAIQGGNRIAYDHIFRELQRKGLKRYIPEEFKNSSGGIFSEVILTHLPVKIVEFAPFYHSSEGAGMTSCRIEIDPFDDKKDIWITTSQLETSSDKGYNKKKQIGHIQTRFKKESRVIFMGDTNIFSFQDLQCPDGWSDAWSDMGDAGNKYTFDHGRNSLAPVPYRERRDRIWYKEFECTKFELVGTKHQNSTSPHFGVYSEFDI